MAAEVLGFIQRKYQDGFDENGPEIYPLLNSQHVIHRTYIEDKDSAARKTG